MKTFIILGVSLLTFIFSSGLSPPATQPNKQTIEGETRETALIGLPYEVARQRILAEGWKISRGSSFAPKAICRRYPEVGYCADVPKNPCGMMFEKPNGCLIVITNGEAFPGVKDHDPHVDHINLYTSKC